MKILERIQEMLKKIGKKTTKTLAAGASIATIGLVTGCGENKETALVDPNIKMAKEDNQYKNNLKVLPEHLGEEIYQKIEEEVIEAKVNQISDIDSLLRFIKDMYIEEYEKKTGDTSLTTKDIEIWERTQDRVYVDRNTEVMITHGEAPAITEQKLTEHGVSYYDKENIEIYEINKKDGEIIDCGALEDGRLKKAVLSKDLFTDKEYAGILTTEELGTIVPKVFECRYFMEQESQLGVTRLKKEIIKILKEYHYKSENQEKASENTNEWEH